MKNIFTLLVFGFVTAIVATFSGSSMTGSAVGLASASFLMPSSTGIAYMAIPIQDARSLFTKMVVAVYKEQVSTTSFLRSFFPTKETMSKEISIEVQRGFEKVAVDVERGTNGNRNTFSKSTEKSFVPPFYWEYLTANEHRLYDVAIGMRDSNSFSELASQTAMDLFALRQKIERAYELQCSQVFDTGIVQLNAGVNIDFKRKAASLVDLSANPWTTGTNDPYKDLENGAKFIRQVGKSQGGVYNVIMGSKALSAFLSNTIVKERADIRNFSLDSVRAPQRNSVGGTLHGEVTA
ncbi:MAG: major capsid protein, partial [Phycisphaerales bacterium]|nr:major capsid protein [Phycisphaerales bacterium]